MKRREYRQGAAVVSAVERSELAAQTRRTEIAKAKERADRTIKSEAHKLALDNKGKSWAKRWLRAHREYLYRNGLIEISP